MITQKKNFLNLKSRLSVIWTLTKKNIFLYIKSGPVLIFGLMFPFFLTLSWVIGRDIDNTQIFIGIIAMTSFFTSTAISPVILPIETREKSLERVISSPVSLIEIILGIVLASFLYSFSITSIITIAFLFLLKIELTSILSYILTWTAIALMGIIGSLLGILVSANPTEKTSDVMVLINLLKFPLIFISGIFIPFESLPFAALFISLFSPITYMVDTLRFAIKRDSFFLLTIDLLVSLIWILALLIANIVMHRKTVVKRFSAVGKKTKKNRG
ncbi:MAG: hypothetical protein GF353_25925 [Candidatus Lokiarchaeota archaeon]|nr:hypothetical protein [Candidatus Lokiarchaeota archaeon]